MHTLTQRGITAGLFLAPLMLGCASAKPAESPPSGPAVTAAQPATMADHQHPVATPAAPAAAHHHDMAGMSMPVTIPQGAIYTAADVHFMQGMIAHHGQAIHMSRLAEARGANPRVLRFATKIDQSQEVEIRLMQEWLRAHNQHAPEAESWRTMSMPGMLTVDQLARLDAAKGVDFDRQFLILMIQHHQGALKMVADLHASPLAAQDVDVSVFATDVEITQTAEIEIMQRMLADL